MDAKTQYVLKCGPGQATLWKGDEADRCFVWRVDGGHVEEIVGLGDRARRVPVMVSQHATLGYVADHKQAGAELMTVCPRGTILELHRAS